MRYPLNQKQSVRIQKVGMSALSTVPPKEQDIDGDNCIAGHDYESANNSANSRGGITDI